jgi:hypothetical protein
VYSAVPPPPTSLTGSAGSIWYAKTCPVEPSIAMNRSTNGFESGAMNAYPRSSGPTLTSHRLVSHADPFMHR